MRRIAPYLITALLTFAIGVSADTATNQIIDYFWPDAEMQNLIPPFGKTGRFCTQTVIIEYIHLSDDTWVHPPAQIKSHSRRH